MSNPAPSLRDRARAIRQRLCPDVVNGRNYVAPEPLVIVPASLHPKDSALADAHDTYLRDLEKVEAIAHALDSAESLSAFRAARAHREEIAEKIAAGTADAADAAESMLPVLSEADYLDRIETLATAVRAARRNIATSVAAYDAIVAEHAPQMIPSAVKAAESLDNAAQVAEAAAAAARSKANTAAKLARDLYIPEAHAALVATGMGVVGGISLRDRARSIVNLGLISAAEGWSSDSERYRAGHPQYVNAASRLVTLAAPVDKETPEQAAARARISERRGDLADGTRRVWQAS